MYEMEKDQGGVGLGVRGKNTRAVVRSKEFINEQLLRVSLKLRIHASVITFVAAYGPSKSTRDKGKKRFFQTALDGARHEHLFVMMNANVRTGRREGWGFRE